MDRRTKYMALLQELETVVRQYELTDLLQSVLALQENMKKFTVRVPVVGGFNAGKSSLMNALLGEDILPVELRPETAIAAELRYGPDRIIAHDFAGGTRTYALEEIHSIHAEQYKYIEVQLLKPVLKQYEGIVLVDMPGLDSGIQDHNKAIFQYVQEGSVFLVVMDCEDGALKSSTLNFLYELDLYQLQFHLLINKVDKKPEGDIAEIVSGARQTVGMLSKTATVETSSDRFEGGLEGLHRVLGSIDRDAAFARVYRGQVERLLELAAAGLRVMVANAAVDETEINQKIAGLEKKMKEMHRVLKQEERNIAKRLQNQVRPAILEDVRNVLAANASALASSAQAGGDSFQTRVNELIRPVLVASTNRHLELSLQDVFQSLSQEMGDVSDLLVNSQGKASQAVVQLEALQKGLELLASGKDLKKLENVYRGIIGGLSIVTTVVAPWVEILLFFLPDILKMFSIGSEKARLEKMKEQIEREMIPQIIAKLDTSIDASLVQVQEEMMNSVQENIDEQLVSLREALQSAIAGKQAKEREHEDYVQQLQEALAHVLRLKASLEEEHHEFSKEPAFTN